MTILYTKRAVYITTYVRNDSNPLLTNNYNNNITNMTACFAGRGHYNNDYEVIMSI